jgi:septation ring formation regulator EzrA
MTRTSLQAMHPIVDNNNVLAAVGKLVHEYDLPISQIQEVVKEVRRCGTEDSQLELVKEKRQELYEESKKSSTVTPKPEKDLTKTVVNFKKFLETGFSGKPFPPVEKFVTDPAQQKTIKEAITDICDLLKTLKQKVR